MAKIELTTELVEAWQMQLAEQVQRCKDGAERAHGASSREFMLKKADHLEGFYSVLTCLLHAHHAVEK